MAGIGEVEVTKNKGIKVFTFVPLFFLLAGEKVLLEEFDNAFELFGRRVCQKTNWIFAVGEDEMEFRQAVIVGLPIAFSDVDGGEAGSWKDTLGFS